METAQIDIWILLFVAAAAQGFFLFFLLISNKKRKKNHNGYLASLILAFTLTLGYYITYWAGVSTSLPNALGIIMFSTFLFGPLIVAYLTLAHRNRLPRYWLFHLSPFAISIVFYFLATYRVVQLSDEAASNLQTWTTYLQNISLVVYAIWALSLGLSMKSTNWGKQLAIAFSGYVACFLAYYIMVWTGTLELQYDYLVSLGMTGFIYFLGYHGFKAPEGLYHKNALKYERSSLTSQALAAIEKKLDKLMDSEKLFTNGDLKLQDVARVMEASANDISQAVNVKKQMKFTDYLNELRVDHAVELMHSDDYKQDKLLAVALDSGFNNKTSFLNAFKKKHGISPSQYRKQIHLKAS